MRFHELAVVAAALAIAPGARADAQACAPQAGRAPVMPTTRVVSGVTVFEHSAGALDRAPCFALQPAPVTVIGGSDGDPNYDLTNAWHVALLSDGRVATLAPIGNKIFVFGTDGRAQHDLAREGKGPGEIMAPGGMIALAGDTLFVPDRANGRFNWIHPDRGFVGSQPLRDVRALGYLVTPAGALPGGRIVVHAGGVGQEGIADSIVRPPAPVSVIDARDGSARRIAMIPDLEIAMIETRYRGVRRQGSDVLRLGRRAHIIVWDTLIATGSGEGYQIDLHAGDGRVVSQLRVPLRRRPVTAPMRDTVIARELERLTRGGAEGMVDVEESKRLTREAPFADSLPPYDRLFVTRGGTLWVLDAMAPTDTSWSATAFRRDGAIIGRLRASGGRPAAFGDDRVVLRSEDSDGIVSLRIHRLIE